MCTSRAAADRLIAIPAWVTQNCDLCYRARTFLRRFHPEIFGPEEIYPTGE
ncbi:MAG: hypothetical protein HOC74_13155 [Gemmatimonadetes bacterium]|jgi:hypothetical protein|nr:hypothetical protein [Gemmatimonadota bacterium]